MYIDVALIDDFKKRYPNILLCTLESILEECGIWYSAEGIRFEADEDLSLEEICSIFYFIIDGNKIGFCSPEQLWDDIEEYFRDD